MLHKFLQTIALVLLKPYCKLFLHTHYCKPESFAGLLFSFPHASNCWSNLSKNFQIKGSLQCNIFALLYVAFKDSNGSHASHWSRGRANSHRWSKKLLDASSTKFSNSSSIALLLFFKFSSHLATSKSAMQCLELRYPPTIAQNLPSARPHYSTRRWS